MAKKVKRKMPKMYDGILPQIEDLIAKKPLSKSMLCAKFNLPQNFFVDYVEASGAYDRGIARFGEKVMENVAETSISDTRIQLKLIDKLKIFEDSCQLPEITDVHTAKQALSLAIKAFAEGKLTELQLQAIRTAVNGYSELCVNTDLAERLERVEEMLQESQNATK